MSRPDHVRLRFLRSVMGYRRGEVIEYPGGPAKALIARGLVEIVADEPQLLEVAMVERRAETADAPQRKKRRVK